MLKTLFILVQIMSFSGLLFGTVAHRVTARNVFTDGTCQEHGIISFLFQEDEMTNISPNQPIYFRIVLEEGTTLCETRVWSHPSNLGNINFNPVYLPLKFFAFFPPATVSAAQDTAAVVRWKKGENSIWIRFQRPTATWVNDGTQLGPPSESNQVGVTVGINASRGWNFYSHDYAAGLANLPSYTRTLPAIGNQADAVSLLHCLDLSETALAPLPAPPPDSQLQFEVFALSAQPGVVESAF